MKQIFKEVYLDFLNLLQPFAIDCKLTIIAETSTKKFLHTTLSPKIFSSLRLPQIRDTHLILYSHFENVSCYFEVNLETERRWKMVGKHEIIGQVRCKRYFLRSLIEVRARLQISGSLNLIHHLLTLFVVDTKFASSKYNFYK